MKNKLIIIPAIILVISICMLFLYIVSSILYSPSITLGSIGINISEHDTSKGINYTILILSFLFTTAIASIGFIFWIIFKEQNQKLKKEIIDFEKQRDEAISANNAKNKFLANLSHEIRTPMNGIIGMNNLLLESSLSQSQKHYAQTIKSCSSSLLVILNDILDFSNIEAGKLDMENMNFDIRSVIEDMTDIMAVKAHEKNIEFACFINHDVPVLLKGDPNRLRQILINITDNAIKYTELGEVSIVVGLKEESETSAVLYFKIVDTGEGISEDKQNLIKNSFSQDNFSFNKEYGGLGLGLSISKQLVHMFGGEIGLDSKKGKGSKFWFNAVFEKQTEKKSISVDIPKNVERKKILIVDDNVTNRTILKEYLNSWKYRFDEAESGQKALELLNNAIKNNDPFNIAILDMQMPEIDGYMLGKKIKENDLLKNTILIMLTSVGTSHSNYESLKKIGFLAYLNKPVKRSQLFNILVNSSANNVSLRPDVKKVDIIQKPLKMKKTKKQIKGLLVEDNLVNQQVAKSIVNNLGYKIDIVGNGKEALNVLENTNYEFILMDIQMPVMDGMEASRQIRNPESNVLDHDIYIIAMTAHAMKGYREKCIEAGMNDYITKPVNPNAVKDALEKCPAILENLSNNENIFEDNNIGENDEDTLLDKDIDVEPEGEKNDFKNEEEAIIEDNEETIPENLFDNDLESDQNEIFDKQTLLERVGGNEEIVKSIVNLFLEEIPNQLNDLNQALADNDQEKSTREAHSLKGASANFGAKILEKVSLSVEMACRSGDLNKAKDIFPTLKKEFEKIKKITGSL